MAGDVSPVAMFCADMILTNFLEVLFFPSPTKHFGHLVLVSFTSVFAGLCFFVLFVWFVPPPCQQQTPLCLASNPCCTTGEAEDWRKCDPGHGRGARRGWRGRGRACGPTRVGGGGATRMSWTGRWEENSHSHFLSQLDGKHAV